jgi:rhodanese-related sulfurtransferase
MKSLLALLTALYAVASQAGQALAVSADDALAAVQSGATVLDVRSERSFAQGHLPGALRLSADLHAQPLAHIAQALSSAGADSSRPLLVVGDAGSADAHALWQRLAAVTSGRTLWLVGGVQEWQLRGHALTQAVQTRLPVPQVLASFEVQTSSQMAGRAVRSGLQLEKVQTVQAALQ